VKTTYHPLRSLAWKEWREQRWRLALGALVLTVLSASLVRAQLVTTAEAVAIVFGPLGLLLSLFLAMGAVPPERAAGTWQFLIVQPVRISRLLLVKWAIGAASLLIALILAGFAAYLAAWSRGVFGLSYPPLELHISLMQAGDSRAVVLNMVGSACAAFIAFYSLLFVAMLRARNELHAGIAGMLLTLVVMAWAAQYPMIGHMYVGERATVLWYATLLNPLSPLLFQFEQGIAFHVLSLIVAPMIWVGIPILLWVRRDRRAKK
jgi:ABC-type transport system involved in multi-copper enzyme maturation permease subunit